MQLRRVLYIGFIALLLPTSPTLVDARAQDKNIQLVITVPEWMGDFYNDEMFADFEAAHPHVDVVLSEAGGDKGAFIVPPAYDLEGFLTDVEAAATSADVMLVHQINPAATQAGFFLNLDPLVRADTSLNPEDFYPAAWQAYQWDEGIWALPVSLDLDFLVYTPAWFDKAGLTYPTPDWTIEDYALAAEALAQHDSAGNVTMPGFVNHDAGAILRLFAGHGFYDDRQFPTAPYFTFPELEPLVTRWKEIHDMGVVGFPEGGMGSETEFGMMLGGLPFLQGGTGRQPALLPGHVALANVQGFAVSAGTQYPELAYELAKYLSNNIVAAYSDGTLPARQSLIDAELPADLPNFRPDYSPEIQAFMDEALMNALPPSQMRYSEYVELVVAPPPDAAPITDVALALQQAEAQAKADIQATIEHHDAHTLVVIPPETLPVLAPGEIGINFGLLLNISPMPNRERWEAFAEEFAANDPEVAYVQIDPYFEPAEHPAEIYDCFYSEGWYLQNNPGEHLITLDPLMAVDPTFDRNDFVPGALAAVQDNDQRTWAFPILISPRILAYNTQQFDQAGLAYPNEGWTISEFVDALRVLHESNGEIPFTPTPWDRGSSYLYMLIAAFGGVPFDVTAEEVHLNLTDPTNVEAIRQVLDLAKAGLIEYSPLAASDGDSLFIGSGSSETAQGIQAIVMSEDWQLGGPTRRANTAPSEDPYGYTTYPYGSSYVPVSYAVKGAYISNQAENPEACYRWISAISQRPDLFAGMPARRSTIDQITDERAEVFYQYDQTLQSPNVVLISDQWNIVEAYLTDYIIGRAFDHYVLEDADLQVELEDAQVIATDIIACIQNLNLPRIDLVTASEEDFAQQIACALNVDPSLSQLFQSN